MAFTSRRPTDCTHSSVTPSRTSGISLRTWAAASRPSWTSCAGVYLFLSTVMRVCTDGAVVRMTAHASAATVRDTMDELMRLGMLPRRAMFRPTAMRSVAYCDADRGTPETQPWGCQVCCGVHLRA